MQDPQLSSISLKLFDVYHVDFNHEDQSKIIKQNQLMHYSFHSTPTCTFRGRTQKVTKSNQPCTAPGPADYTVKKPLHKTATISNTSQIRNLYKKFETNPGPGTYQSKSHITDGTKRSMSLKFIDYNKQSPGPQDYQTQGNKVLNKAPVFSLGNKSKSNKQIDFDHNSYKPGPQSYQTKGELLKKHGTFIGSSDRKPLDENEKTPGPNHYMSASAADFASISNPRCRIGSEFRKTDFKKGQNTPGPAVYEKTTFIQENASKNKGYSCRKKVADLVAQELSRNPGPGQYESHLKNKNAAPRCSTTQTKRKTFMDDTEAFKKSYPGPGYHDPAFAGTKYRASSSNGFSKSPRKPLDENQKTPGPVEYRNDKINMLNSAPKYSSTKTVAKNQFLGVNPETAAPGSYDPLFTQTKPRCSVSNVPKEKRPDFEKQRQTPGPGFYNLRGKQEGPNWKFPQEKRQAFTDSKNEAKNGTHYELTSKVVNPPSYMNVTSKIQYSPAKTGLTRA